MIDQHILTGKRGSLDRTYRTPVIFYKLLTYRRQQSHYIEVAQGTIFM